MFLQLFLLFVYDTIAFLDNYNTNIQQINENSK